MDAAALRALAAPPHDTRRIFHVGGVSVGIVTLCTPVISRSTAPAAAVVRARSMRPPVAAFRVVPGGRPPTLPWFRKHRTRTSRPWHDWCPSDANA